MSAPSFRLYKARGQPGQWYGYVEIDGVTYKIDAKHVGERAKKHFVGVVKRHLKADQQSFPLLTKLAENIALHHAVEADAAAPDFDDEIPF
jgi:hypothetical protein